MKTKTILLSIIMLTALVLTACGGNETETVVPSTKPPSSTETSVATEPPSGTETLTSGDLTTTPGIPVTGGENAARLSNELDFHVWSQDGKEIGEVKDMVIDVDNAKITYVIVGTGGFLEVGEKDIVVPWNQLTLQTGDGSATGGKANAFVLKADMDRFSNFPSMDWKSNFPKLGEPAKDWDLDIRNYWENGTVPGGTTGTVVPDTTTTVMPEGTTVPDATATTTTGQAQNQGQGLGLGNKLQGVMLASDVLGSTVSLSGVVSPGQSVTPAQPLATATSGGTTTTEATATPGGATAPLATATLGTSENDTANMSFTIKDMIVDTNNGKILYIVVSSSFSDGERWIPIPLGMLQWDGTNQTFSLNTDGSMLSNAPFFTEDQFPDVTTTNWDKEFSTYWKTGNAGTGTGTGTGEATATAKP